MNCAEVMEWMHRYLDHDLNRLEAAEMFRHIDSCPSCAALFERLKTLSNELERLPDVRPPFSLVDSILPQLDEIDREAAHKTMAVSETAGEDGPAVPLRRVQDAGKRRRGSSMAARTGIGAVAAAVLLGIAILNMPERLPGAQVERMMDQNTSGTASTSEVTDGGETADNSAVSSGAADSGAADNASGGLNGAAEPGMMSFAAESAAPAGEETADGAGGGEAAGSTPAASAPQAGAQNKDNAQRKEAVSATRQPEKTRKPAAAPTVRPKAVPSNDATRNTKGSDLRETTEGGPEGAMEAGIMSLVPPSTVDLRNSSWTSPDGRYQASLEGERLVIYSLSGTEGSQRTESGSVLLDGAWVSGGWSSNGSFDYIVEQDGKQVHESYKPAVPSPGAPSAKPAVTPEATPAAAPSAAPSAASPEASARPSASPTPGSSPAT